MKVEVFHNPETDLFDLKVIGSDEWDDMNDLEEQEAIDEAEAIASEIDGEIVFV